MAEQSAHSNWPVVTTLCCYIHTACFSSNPGVVEERTVRICADTLRRLELSPEQRATIRDVTALVNDRLVSGGVGGEMKTILSSLTQFLSPNAPATNGNAPSASTLPTPARALSAVG